MDLIRNTRSFIKETNIDKFYLKKSNTEIPTNNYARTWIDRDGHPYKYEFRGNEFMGYLNPNELILVRH